MSGPVIETPRGVIITTAGAKAKLVWNKNFKPKHQGRFTRAQKFVDSEVLRRCEPYIPLRTGVLVKSGILGTVLGSGLVEWGANYAKAQYYSPREPGSSTGPLRGPYWFERMNATDGQDIIRHAKAIAGGRE
jgi:hypothetical protein